MLEKLFKLRENNTNIKTEVLAGLTTFMTMAYILAVNPDILSASGMDKTAVLMATSFAAFLGTLCMAFFANYPFALAPGMGLNAYFAFTVCGSMGVPWQTALFAVFVEGIIFIVLSLTNVRESLFNVIPATLKLAVSGGIGLFIAFIGLQDAGLVIPSESTLVTYIDFSKDFYSSGIAAVLSVAGVIITAILLVKKIKGSILFGIIITWILGMILELTGIFKPEVSVIPTEFFSFDISAIDKTFAACFNVDFDATSIFNFIVIIFSFLFVDLFDTLGTLIGVSSKAGMLDEDGKLPRIKGALLADAVATCAGAVLGTSTTTTYVESASGVSEGGRTGLTAAVTGLLFLLSIFISPLFMAIPSFAIAPALIIVGFYMISSITKINFEDAAEGIPAFLTIIAMPLAYSISEGITIGIISYTLVNLLTGNAKKKKIGILMYILTILFICKYIFL